ncbi:hypothetical protein E4T39_07931 [Aureobasidium subglaciale]|nr:hypothetical protein E4T39_07931 [Aureobasidium subglaciale]
MTACNAAKDIFVLLCIIHISNVDITTDLTNKIVELWPVELGVAPADGEELRQHIVKIGQQSIDSVSPSTPIAINKDYGGTSLVDAIMIDDIDDEDDVVNHRLLPRKFRVPPAASLVTPHGATREAVGQGSCKATKHPFQLPTPRSLGESIATTPKKVTERFSHGENSARCPLTVENRDGGPTTPGTSDRPRVASSTRKTGIRIKPGRAIKMKALCNNSARNPLKVSKDSAVNDSEADEETCDTPTTITTTRKRRRGVDYKWVHRDPVFDGADDDYAMEEDSEDERLDKRFAMSCPTVVTPSKPQRKR